MNTLINCFLIVIGAIIMLICIVKAKGLMESLNFVPERQRKHLTQFLMLHRALMVFFFSGYLVVLAAYVFQYEFISDTFVSLIFFFGAIFVFIGIIVQTRLLSEVQNTLQGILPICCKCKKIRTVDANYKDSTAWKRIEEFLSEKTHVGFTHGYCPECGEEEKRNVRRMCEKEI